MKKLLLTATILTSGCATVTEMFPILYEPETLSGCTSEPAKQASERISKYIYACFANYTYKSEDEFFQSTTHGSGNNYLIEGRYSGSTTFDSSYQMPGTEITHPTTGITTHVSGEWIHQEDNLPFDDIIFALNLHPAISNDTSCKTNYSITFYKSIKKWQHEKVEKLIQNQKRIDALYCSYAS